MAITLSTSIGAVTIREAFEAYEAGIDLQRGPYINKVYLAPSSASAFPVINALVGAGNRPVRHVCPESPNLRCVSAVLAPKGEYDVRDGGRPQFNLSLIKATYAVPTWEELTSDDPSGNMSFPNEITPGQPYVYMEQTIDFDTELVKFPGSAYKFETAPNLNVDVPPAISVAVAQFTLVRRWQTQLPYAPVTTYLNKLNSSTFLGQPKGQMKFLKAQARRQNTSDGTRAQEVALVFKWREFDHNAQHRPDGRTFDRIVDSGGKFPFNYANLTALLL